MRAWFAIALFAAAGCAPRIVWTGGDEGRRVRAEVLAGGGAQWVRIDGREGPRANAIGEGGIVLSSDGRRFAYPVQRDGRWSVAIDGSEDGPWDGVAELIFSRDSERFAFLAQQAGKWRAVIDGVRGPELDAIEAGSLQFSRNGAHAGYAATSAGCAAIVIDGVARPCGPPVVSLRLTESGTAAAVVRDGRRVRFLLGDKLDPPCDAIGDQAVTEDGRRAAYAAFDHGAWRAVIDGVPGARLRSAGSFRFGDGGRRLAFIARSDSSARVVIDGVEGPSFATVGRLRLAPEGSRYAYSAEDASGAFVIVDGQRSEGFAAVLDLVLSADGRHLAFVARRDGRTLVVHDGSETAVKLVIDATLVLSEDGEHWAALSGDPTTRRFFVLLDGKEGSPIAADEVFGDGRSLRPLIARALAAALEQQARLGDPR
jgi:hypothetical protein